jgi:D-alanyl-D-alanine dipeptidase
LAISRSLGYAFGYLTVCGCLAVAQPNLSSQQHAVTSTCKVASLPAIEDPEALAFEANVGTEGVVNVDGLTSAMASALATFRQMVISLGGRFELKSAYRPPAYQEHLQAVWDTWIKLRRNRTAGCQALRAEVKEEFERHHLLETQRPVSSSDHTRGMAFDAAIIMPVVKRLTRSRRFSLDRLALLAGIRRPDIRHDPVHFRLVANPVEAD